MAFVLIMAGIALGEAIAAFLIKSLGIRAEAEALQAEIERMRIIERHIDEDIATAARVALAAGSQSIAAAKESCEQVFQQLVAKSDDSYNSFIGFVDEIEDQREAEHEEFAALSRTFEARIGEKFPGMFAVGRKAATPDAAAAADAAPVESADVSDGTSGSGCADACANGAAAPEIPLSDQAKAA